MKLRRALLALYRACIDKGALAAGLTLGVALITSLAFGANQDLYNFLVVNLVGLGLKQLTRLDFVLLLSSVWSILLCLMLSLRVNRDKVLPVSMTYLIIFLSLVACILSASIFAFFWFYEMLLLASAYLVLMSSPNKRSKKVALYFLFWTQAGSFILFCSVAFIALRLTTTAFPDLFSLQASKTVVSYLALALFLAFGIKLPIWPFHF